MRRIGKSGDKSDFIATSSTTHGQPRPKLRAKLRPKPEIISYQHPPDELVHAQVRHRKCAKVEAGRLASGGLCRLQVLNGSMGTVLVGPGQRKPSNGLRRFTERQKHHRHRHENKGDRNLIGVHRFVASTARSVQNSSDALSVCPRSKCECLHVRNVNVAHDVSDVDENSKSDYSKHYERRYLQGAHSRLP
jgi:hypothetical protein